VELAVLSKDVATCLGDDAPGSLVSATLPIRREEHHLPVSGIRRQEVQGEKTVLAAAVEEDDQ